MSLTPLFWRCFWLIIRTDELFDIIVDYPDSLPALEDLEVSCSRDWGCSL